MLSKQLEGFVTPLNLLNQVEPQLADIPSERLFNDPALQKLLESWCAAVFGHAYSVSVRNCKVKVHEGAERLDADFSLLFHDRVWPFQLVEALNPGRKRGDEYKRLAKSGQEWLFFDAANGKRNGPSWIASAVRKKVLKRYAGCGELSLLVYANFGATGLQYSDVVDALKPFDATFKSIWIFSDTHICTCYAPEEMGIVGGWLKFAEPAWAEQ